MIEIILPIETYSEANGRMIKNSKGVMKKEYWRATAARLKQQREDVKKAYHDRQLTLGLPCIVEFTRISPRLLDDDNLVSAFKSIRDAVAECLTGRGKGRGDRDPRLKFRYEQEKGSVKSIRIRFITQS